MTVAAAAARKCAECGKDLPPRAGTGRPRLYCDDPCRWRARDRKRAGWQALGDLAVMPVDPHTTRVRAAEAIVAVLEDVRPGPPEDRLAAWLIEAAQLSFAGRRIAEDLPPDLRARAQACALAIRAAIEREFPGVL